jgi:hypothetical protein
MLEAPGQLYLAGPMSGVDRNNRPKFDEVAGWLRGEGHTVFNPAENKDGGVKQRRSFYMRIDLPALMGSDAIVLLPGWYESRGASLEAWMALDLDMPIFEFHDSDGRPALTRVTDLDLGSLPFRR